MTHWDAVSKMPQDKTKVFIGKMRKDKKVMLTYCFHARQVRKLISQEELSKELEQTDKYTFY